MKTIVIADSPSNTGKTTIGRQNADLIRGERVPCAAHIKLCACECGVF